MYEMSVRVRFSDIGCDGKLRLYELPKYFQNISIEYRNSLFIREKSCMAVNFMAD